jgi:hypothetical protein
MKAGEMKWAEPEPAPPIARRRKALLQARAGVAVDLAAKRDFGDFRGLPGHGMLLLLI